MQAAISTPSKPRKPFGQNNRSYRPETPAEKARRTGTVAKALADEMIEREAASGNCTVDDLAYAGFTAAEITEHAHEAREIARRSAVRETA